MKNNRKLQIEQLDRKLVAYANFPDVPGKGWINGIRTVLKCHSGSWVADCEGNQLHLI